MSPGHGSGGDLDGRVHVEADLAIGVDDAQARLRGRGSALELVSEHPWRFARRAAAGGAARPARRASRATGVEIRLTGPRGAVATLRADGAVRPAPRVLALGLAALVAVPVLSKAVAARRRR